MEALLPEMLLMESEDGSATAHRGTAADRLGSSPYLAPPFSFAFVPEPLDSSDE